MCRVLVQCQVEVHQKYVNDAMPYDERAQVRIEVTRCQVEAIAVGNVLRSPCASRCTGCHAHEDSFALTCAFLRTSCRVHARTRDR